MVICAACKAYTDDQEPNCAHCGSALEADGMERIAALAHHPIVAGLAQDSERALLVASAVVAANAREFFFVDDQRGYSTVLARLLGPASDPRAKTAGVIFAAYVFLAEKGYCALAWDSEEQRIGISGVHPWDGQQKCIERALTEQMARVLNTYDATEQMLRELMGFHVLTVRARAEDGSRVRSMPDLSAVAAVDQTARLTVLPEYDHSEACRDTYGLLVRFVRADEERAQQLALETLRILDWVGAA
jgi:hypothetical protein